MHNHRIHRLAIVLGLLCISLPVGYAQAARFKQRGVEIPDAPDMFVQGMTQLDKTQNGATLILPLDVTGSWQLLNRVLENLAVKFRERDVQQHRLVSDWILWVWDPGLEVGRSKPPLKALSRSYERHRFAFSLHAGTTADNAVLHIHDQARQREVDITPDSEYTWLQWQGAPPQTEAARSFLRRLQGDFEAALSSRLVPSVTVAPPRTGHKPAVTAPPRIVPALTVPEQTTAPARPGPQSKPVVVSPSPVMITPPVSVRAPVGTAIEALPLPTTAPVKPPVTTPPPAAEQSTVTVESSTRAQAQPTVQQPPPVTVSAPPGERTEITAHSSSTAGRLTKHQSPAHIPTAVQGGLLVDGNPNATWQALHRAITTLGVGLQSSDQAQHMLTTRWISARYNPKNQQFLLKSNEDERWQLNIWGNSRERHRFQLIVIPVDGGVRSLVFAYHTGYQVETDRTPDSSQTLLYWKDRKPDPAIAMAFLRRLRLMVSQ